MVTQTKLLPINEPNKQLLMIIFEETPKFDMSDHEELFTLPSRPN